MRGWLRAGVGRMLKTLNFRFKISTVEKSIFTAHKKSKQIAFQALEVRFINWVERVKNINSKHFYDCCSKGGDEHHFYRPAKSHFNFKSNAIYSRFRESL